MEIITNFLVDLCYYALNLIQSCGELATGLLEIHFPPIA